MKTFLCVGLAAVGLMGWCGEFGLSDTLPLGEAIERAEKGDALGLYSMAINFAKAGRASSDRDWFKSSAGKFLFLAEEAGSGDAMFLLGALAERKLYLGLGEFTPRNGRDVRVRIQHDSGKVTSVGGLPPEEVATSSMPTIDRNIPSLTGGNGDLFELKWPWTSRWSRRVSSDEITTKLVFHPGSASHEDVAYRYFLREVTNEVVKTYVREHYVKAKELCVAGADEALWRFETNCLRMAAILEAQSPKDNALTVRELLGNGVDTNLALKCQAQTEQTHALTEREKAQREAERAEQRAQLLAIQEELKRVREAKTKDMEERK